MRIPSASGARSLVAGAAMLLAAAAVFSAKPPGPRAAGDARPFGDLVREARDYARAGDARARDRYLAAVRQRPSDASLRAELADYFWSTGDPTEAESQMDWLVARGNPRPGFLRYYGLRLFDAGNFVKASDVLEKAARESAPDYDLLFCLGSARVEKGDFRGAEQSLRAAVDKSPAQAGAHHVLGRLLNLAGRHRDAVDELRRAAGAEAENAAVWLDLAQALAADGSPAEAEEACRRSIRLAPGRAAAHMTLGRILRAEQKTEEAASELAASRALYDREESAAEIDRGSTARTSQAWVLLRMDRAAEALAQFESLPENSASAWRGRAEALEKLGRREEALRALERAKSLAPEDRSLDYMMERLRAARPR